MPVKQVKTSELTGAALDWAVSKAEGMEGFYLANPYSYSTNWLFGGPIIEREGINLFQRKGAAARDGRAWLAYTSAQLEKEGPTPLIAAMRCYVASKLGESVEVPEELI